MEEPDASTRNHTAYFHAKYNRAHHHFSEGNLALADDTCRELIADFACPRLVQVRAWQIRSLCTKDFFLAKLHLNEVFPLLSKIPAEYDLALDDPTHQEIAKAHVFTTSMLHDLQSRWNAQWAAIGQMPPETEEETDARDTRMSAIGKPESGATGVVVDAPDERGAGAKEPDDPMDTSEEGIPGAQLVNQKGQDGSIDQLQMKVDKMEIDEPEELSSLQGLPDWARTGYGVVTPPPSSPVTVPASPPNQRRGSPAPPQPPMSPEAEASQN